MQDITGIDWEDAFSNAAYIADGASFPDRWAERAKTFRAKAQTAQIDIPYGSAPREKLDLFLPQGRPHGVVVFVHGGFWCQMDKSLWSHLAQGPLQHGWAVAMPGYTLAPDARISDITRQIAAAVTRMAEQVAGPIRLIGHSAGGHLVTRMICQDSPLSPAIQMRIQTVVSLSGVHDLRPLQLHSMNADLRLDVAEIATESPALLRPVPGVKVTCWTGANERPEFLRQAALLVEAWAGKTDMQPPVFAPHRHHFDVIDPLAQPDSDLVKTLLA